MRYTFDQLMTFERVARTRSFSAAARELKRAPSAVSMAMANLEIELNVGLFVRTPRQVELTAEGQSLLAYTRVVLESCQALEQRSLSFSQQIESEISLAIEIPWSLIAPVLYEFSMTFPQTDIHIREPFHGDVEAMVASGDADLGIAISRPIDTEKVQFAQLGKIVMVHVVSAVHPLAQKIPVTTRDLQTHRQITFGGAAKSIATTEYLSGPSQWRVESYYAMLDAVRAGIGWASIPAEFIRQELNQGDLLELRQQEYPHTDWLVGIDMLWGKRQAQGKATCWLRSRLMHHKISEHDTTGNRTTL